jgi:hypothetical protein
MTLEHYDVASDTQTAMVDTLKRRDCSCAVTIENLSSAEKQTGSTSLIRPGYRNPVGAFDPRS